MIRVGIIGCGKIAQVRHIPEYAACPHTELAAYYDWNLERAEELAAKYGGRAYDSLEALLEDDKIDAVSVCVANQDHAEATMAALKAGKHVLCEKPMAVTIKECEEMVRAAKECNRKLMIGQNQRTVKTHVKAKELLKAGVLGKVLTFRTTFGHGGPETWSIDPGANTWFFDKKKAVMGAMADLGVHKTDLIQFLLGQRVAATTARLCTLDKKDAKGNLIGVDDNAFCIYEMEDGTVGTMTSSWTHYGAEDNSTVLYGEKGIMKIFDQPGCSLKIIFKDGTIQEYKEDVIQTNDNQTSTGIIDAFAECIVNDKEPDISGEGVLAAMRAIFASIQSSEEGRRVEISLD